MRKLIFMAFLLSSFSFANSQVELQCTNVDNALKSKQNLKIDGVSQFIEGSKCYRSNPPNYEEAFKWFSLSRENGNRNGIFMLGVMYQEGYFVGKNKTKALEFYKEACDLGNLAGCTSVEYIDNHF